MIQTLVPLDYQSPARDSDSTVNDDEEKEAQAEQAQACAYFEPGRYSSGEATLDVTNIGLYTLNLASESRVEQGICFLRDRRLILEDGLGQQRRAYIVGHRDGRVTLSQGSQTFQHQASPF